MVVPIFPAAHQASPSWSRSTPQQRSLILLGIADGIEKRADQLTRLEALNCGKPLHLAGQDDLGAAVDVFRFFAGASRCLSGSAAGVTRRMPDSNVVTPCLHTRQSAHPQRTRRSC